MSSRSEIINFDFMSKGVQEVKGGAKGERNVTPLTSEERGYVRENIRNLLHYIFE